MNIATHTTPLDIEKYRCFIHVDSLFRRFGIVRRDKNEWRLCEQSVGQICGLPASRGKLLATNGVDIIIECQDGSCYLGPELARWEKDTAFNEAPTRKARFSEIYQ